MTLVSCYLDSVLLPLLRRRKLSLNQAAEVRSDVEGRLFSLLRHWELPEIRRTLLLPGIEEATFYEPTDAPLEIRALVVMAVRNSLIEDLGTTRPYHPQLRRGGPWLSDGDMQTVTGDAIDYFANVSLDCLRAEVPATGPDPFGPLSTRFPRAWEAISRLANGEAPRLAPVMSVPLPSLPPLEKPFNATSSSILLSGVDPTFDPLLVSALHAIATGRLKILFSPTFRGLTRQTQKLFRTIDIVLAYGGSFVTHNYALTPSEVYRREKLLRPVHTTGEQMAQLSDVRGLAAEHRELLACAAEAAGSDPSESRGAPPA